MVTDDPLLVRWGLHDLLDGFQNTGVGRTSVQLNDAARTEFFQAGESYTVRGHSSVENDEVIAHALQEELVAEGSERPQDWHNWSASSTGICIAPNYELYRNLIKGGLVDISNYIGRSVKECTEEIQHRVCKILNDYELVTPDIWPAGEAAQNVDYDSSPYCDNNSGQDSDDSGVPELSDDFSTYDGEVGKRLTHMDSIPHVPRINGEIPTSDDASAAHQRLFDRLKLYGLSELKVDGDGNCQFRAFSDQLYRTPAHHKSVRDDIVNQLRSHPELYEGYVPMKYDEYVKKLAKSGEWGDHVTLQAAADFFGVRICLLTSFKDTCFIQILPRHKKSTRVIFLSFWAEVHYNSIYPDGDVPLIFEAKKKKRHWRQYFKNKLKM